MRTWLAPRHYERRYGRFLRKTVAQLRIELLARLAQVFRSGRRPIETESEELDVAIEQVFEWWRAKREENQPTYAGYYSIVNIFNDIQFLAVVKSLTKLSLPPTSSVGFKPGVDYSNTIDMLSVLGKDADIYRQEPYLEKLRDVWIKNQDTYLDNVVTQTIKNSETAIRNGILTSATSKVIKETIEKQLETTSKRVERGGSEAVVSLDSILTRERQKSIGANEYIWETMKDERVRGDPTGLYPNAKPSHYVRQGVVFNWNRPPEGGHPGEAFGCRCKALMRLPR